MHLGFALQPRNAFAKSPTVSAHRLLQAFIAIKDCPEPERQNRPLPEANAHHPRMLENVSFFIQRDRGAIELADDYRKISAWITEDG
jgi:hypothetical protein